MRFMTVESGENPGRLFFAFLKNSFPDLNYKQFQKINSGKNFKHWVCIEDESGAILGCAAIFLSTIKGYKMGLFCISKNHRRKGYGKYFYHEILRRYSPLEWTAKTDESIDFYKSIGAICHGYISTRSGERYMHFSSDGASVSESERE